MFKNIGRKIKGLAKIVFWVEAVSTVLAGLGFIIASIFMVDHAIAILGSVIVSVFGVALLLLLEWLSVWMLYAFGELVDNSTIIANEVKERKSPRNMPAPPHPLENVEPAEVQ